MVIADCMLLDDIEFKIGIPYVFRHSTCNENESFQVKPSVENCCDHVFVFNGVELAQARRDSKLLQSETGSLDVGTRIAKRMDCEYCMT